MNTKKQLFSTFLILIGAVFLIYGMIMNNSNVYINIIGIVTLMVGLYSSTRVWVDDNKKEKKNDEEN